jgi:hypothetical protein
MLVTLVRAIGSLEVDNVGDAYRLLSLLHGMIEGAIDEAQQGP